MINIFGVNISNLNQSETLSRVSGFLVDGRQNLIFTPNPEMLVDSQADWFFKTALNKADLAPADGFGLVLAAKYLYKTFLNRFPGIELMEKICELAAQGGKSIYLVGGGKGIAELAAGALRKRYPNLKIVGAEKGIVFNSQFPIPNSQTNSKYQIPNTKYLVGVNFDQESNQELLDRIKKASPDILFVAFGHKKQEKWLAEFIGQLPSVKIGMGVGGSFDYLSGKINRAPKLIRRMGFEWLWRLILEPSKRLGRIWKAIFVFTFYIILAKWVSHLPYRQGAVGFITNKEGKFFLGKRVADSHLLNLEHWQLPQGGLNKGETAEEAVIREMREETGMQTRIICAAQTPHQYDWSLSLFDKKKHLRYRGQNQKVFLLRYDGGGADIKLDKHELGDFRWVNLDDLRRLLHPQRKGSLDILLKECSHLISK